MTHHRTKPDGAVRTYGVLVGHVVEGREFGGGRSPHYEILVQADGQYRVAVNVRSVDGSDVLAFIDDDFTHSTRVDLSTRAAGAAGFTALPTGPAGTGLDYLRDDLFALDKMMPVAADGSGAALGPMLDSRIQEAVADPGSVVLAFGEFFQDAGRDTIFGFSPERGVHDIHMMQGNSGSFGDDNRVRGDGALFLRASSGRMVALFVRFATQSVDTDPSTGAPV